MFQQMMPIVVVACCSLDQAVISGNLGELYQRFKSSRAVERTSLILGSAVEESEEPENKKSEKVLNETEYEPEELDTITYIVSSQDRKTILATIKNEDDWEEYKSRNKKTQEHLQNQVQRNMEGKRKGKFVLLHSKHDEKPNLILNEDNSPDEDPEKEVADVSPEEWLAQFYSTEEEKKTSPPVLKKMERKSVKSDKKRAGTALPNFEQLLLRSPSRPDNSSDKLGNSLLTGHFMGRNGRRPVRKSELVHLIPVSQEPEVEELLNPASRRESSLSTPLEIKHPPRPDNWMTSWTSSGSQRWRPVFSPSEKEERRVWL